MKFKERNKYVYIVSFWLLIVAVILSAINYLKFNLHRFNINNIAHPYEAISINLETNKKLSNDLFVCFNSYCKTPVQDSYSLLYSLKFDESSKEFFNGKIKNVYLVYPKNNKLPIDNIDIHVGAVNYYFNNQDISAFKAKPVSIQPENSNKKLDYSMYKLPVKNNYGGILTHLCVLFLSLFYHWDIFIYQYIALFIAFGLYIFNKDDFNFKFDLNNKTCYMVLGLFILIGTIVRLSNINYFPLQTDEIYTKIIASKGILSSFQNTANPPLFYILEHITQIFGKYDFILRILPCIYGILLIPTIFLLFKNYNKKLALFAAFYSAINIVNIAHSQEALVCSFSGLLVILTVYFLFNYLQNTSTKNLVLYTIASIFMINTSYFLAITVFTNFIWGFVDLAQNKNKKLPFIFANIMVLLTFIPYLLISTKTTNAIMPYLNKDIFHSCINALFINKYVFIILCAIILIYLILSFIPQKCYNKLNLNKDPQKENMFIYLVYSIAFVIIIASLISLFIKPIINDRSIFEIYGLIMLVEIIAISSIFEFKNFNKCSSYIRVLLSLILCFICFSITKMTPINKVHEINTYMHFIQNDIKQYKGYNIHVLSNGCKECLSEYPKIKGTNINWHFIDTTNGNILVKISKKNYIKNNEKTIIYANSDVVEFGNILLYAPLAKIYTTNSANIVKMIYDGE